MKTKDIAVAVALMAIAAAVWILYPTATVADSYSGRLSDARFVEARDVLVDYAKRNRARGIVALKSHDARMGVLLYCDTAQMMRLVSLADGVTYLSVDEGAELRAPEVAALTRQVADMLGKGSRGQHDLPCVGPVSSRRLLVRASRCGQAKGLQHAESAGDLA